MNATFIYLLLAINILAYGVMVADKLLAVSKSRRIPEAWLFILALVMGAPGILLGMFRPIRHKSSKAVFRLLIPFLVMVQAIGIYMLMN